MNADARTYTFDWRPDEHARVTSLLMREQLRSGVWRAAKWGIVAVLTLAVLLSALTAILGDTGSSLRLLPPVIALAALMKGFPTLVGRLQAWRVKGNDPNVGHPFTYVLDDAGLHVQMRTISAELKWAGMHTVRETPDMFLFHYSRYTAYFLPKRALGSADEGPLLADWIRSRLPSGVSYVVPR